MGAIGGASRPGMAVGSLGAAGVEGVEAPGTASALGVGRVVAGGVVRVVGSGGKRSAARCVAGAL